MLELVFLLVNGLTEKDFRGLVEKAFGADEAESQRLPLYRNNQRIQDRPRS